MIDNFAPQPYPLECSADGGQTWQLVIGWRELVGDLAPLVATDDGLMRRTDALDKPLRYRLADTRPVTVRPAAAPSARVEPRRERGA